MSTARLEIERLLRGAMGLDPGSIGWTVIGRAVHERAAARGARGEPEYAALLRESAVELQALVELVVVPETWFLRDREAFATLAAAVRGDWQQAPLRLLSLPCSTGEEPYSMAMALLDAGIPAERFQIDAVDISARSLEIAQRALYRKNSFRGADLGFRERHFEAVDGGWRPVPRVRAAVSFQQGNVLTPGFLAAGPAYDAIFCRNMLIYFDRFAQAEALKALARRLRNEGLLFVAAAETGLLAGLGFAALRAPLAFAFRKQVVLPGATDSTSGAGKPPRSNRPAPAAQVMTLETATPAAASASTAAEAATVASAPAASGLDEARRLADLGRLAEAGEICAAHLREHGPSAPALYLLGLVRDAAGELDDAARYYRQTLYLDPAHEETLMHLALLLDKQGDRNGAQLLRNRAKRRQRVQLA